MTRTKKPLTMALFASILYMAGCGQITPSFLPPVLSDTSGLDKLVSLDPQALVIQEESAGSLVQDESFRGHVTSVGADSSLTVSLQTSIPTGLALYGPRDSHGLFGSAIVVTSASSGHATMSRTRLAEGDYLVLVANLQGMTGDYRLLASCDGQCKEPRCPALVCGKYCGTGLKHSQDGCTMCQCAPACADDTDCPLEFTCTDGVCSRTNDSCDCDEQAYSPVCGADRKTYANLCELNCAGIDLASQGACAKPQCSTDNDCASGMICSDARCVSQCQCDGEPMNEQCGLDGLTYFNPCERQCAGVGLDHQGACDICNTEICGDGLDNDCDGFIDEGCDEPCASDADCPQDKVCMGGVCAGAIPCNSDADCPANQICEASTATCRTEGECSPEVCDGVDNDCDGTIDEGCPACRSDSDCAQSELCIEGLCTHQCQDADQDGFMDDSCGGQDCDDKDPAISPSADEICDDVDNDCDGQTDEDCEQTCSSDSDCAAGQVCMDGTCQAERCSSNDDCAAGQTCVDGICVDANCDADGDGFEKEACGGTDCNDADPTINSAAEEICDGKDNDCDGQNDEGCGQECFDGDSMSCGSDVGECSTGTMTCENGYWGSCQGAVGPVGESCDNLDNDCDGDVDESCGLFCRTDEECESNEVCVNNACTSPCASNSDCPETWICNMSSGFCEP